jgi:hypothetical protein
MADYSRVLDAIGKIDDPQQLRNTIKNARTKGVDEVAAAAFLRLVEILPEHKPGTVEHDFWRTIGAFEEALREARGKAVRLAKTRLKITRSGVKQALADFSTDPTSAEGFRMIMDRQLPELTGEAVILRHADDFSPEVVSAARLRLSEAGVNVEALAA